MKIGFFGGAFDPFHVEHERIVTEAQKELGLDAVVVYPSCDPPHKTGVSPYAARRKMTEEALKDYSFVVIDDVERDRKALRNPTCEILPLLLDKYAPDESYFLMGGDSLINFGKWIHPEIIAKTAKIAVVARGSADFVKEYVEKQKRDYGADITLLSYVGKRVSASVEKAHVELGDTPEGLKPGVVSVIQSEGLYTGHEEMIRTLRASLNEKRFIHVKGVVYYALRLNETLGLPYEQVFTAALLHDCAKPYKRDMPGVPGPVVHQFLGVEIAQNAYGVTDRDVLNAIGCHTTGKPAMTTLDKLIFCADMLEQNRCFEGVDDLRACIEADFEKGFLACINASYAFVVRDKMEIHPLTKECLAYYNK